MFVVQFIFVFKFMEKAQKPIPVLIFQLIINGFREIALNFLKLLLLFTVRFNINLTKHIEHVFSDRIPFRFEIETDDDSDFKAVHIGESREIRRESFQNLISIQSIFVSDLKNHSALVKSEKLYQLVPSVDNLLSTNIQFHHYMEHLQANDKDGVNYISKLYNEFPDIITNLKLYLDQVSQISKVTITNQTREILEIPLQIIDLYIKEMETIKTTITNDANEIHFIEKTIKELAALKESQKVMVFDSDYSSE